MNFTRELYKVGGWGPKNQLPFGLQRVTPRLGVSDQFHRNMLIEFYFRDEFHPWTRKRRWLGDKKSKTNVWSAPMFHLDMTIQISFIVIWQSNSIYCMNFIRELDKEQSLQLPPALNIQVFSEPYIFMTKLQGQKPALRAGGKCHTNKWNKNDAGNNTAKEIKLIL